jgi:predicted acyl esterase
VVATASILVAETHEVKLERDVPAKMRDGAIVYAEICRPRAEGTFPVVLSARRITSKDGVDVCLKAAARGYAVVIQDVRGGMPLRANGTPSSMKPTMVTTPSKRKAESVAGR